MPLMCCDACSEIDFKPLDLDVSPNCFCEACKKISTHTLLAQTCTAGAKKINFKKPILKHKFKYEAELIFENSEFVPKKWTLRNEFSTYIFNP